MAIVYSTRVFMAHAATALSYEVPAGQVLVVRDADFFYSGGIGSYSQLEGPAGEVFAFASFPASIDGAWIGWRGRQVFYPAETVTFASTDGVDITVSGYLLTLP